MSQATWLGGPLCRNVSRPLRLRKALHNSTTLAFDDMGEAFRLLRQPRTLDCCYRANAELMRRGASMYRQYNNPYLVEDILAGL